MAEQAQAIENDRVNWYVFSITAASPLADSLHEWCRINCDDEWFVQSRDGVMLIYMSDALDAIPFRARHRDVLYVGREASYRAA